MANDGELTGSELERRRKENEKLVRQRLADGLAKLGATVKERVANSNVPTASDGSEG